MKEINLSILIPLYEFKDGLQRILNSLENIDIKYRKEIEIIISDDSKRPLLKKTQNTYLENSFQNFKYIHNKKPLGPSANWNKLIKTSKGQYYWLLHHDEYWDEKFHLIKYIFNTINKSNPKIITFTVIKEWKIYFRKLKIILYQNHNNEKMIENIIKSPKQLLMINMIGPPSTLIISKSSKVLFDPKYKYLIDVDLYIRLFEEIDINKIQICKMNGANIFSMQYNKSSITKTLGRKLKCIIRYERRQLMKRYKYNFNLVDYIIIFYKYLNLKILSILSTKIIFKK